MKRIEKKVPSFPCHLVSLLSLIVVPTFAACSKPYYEESVGCAYMATAEFGGEFPELDSRDGCLVRDADGYYQVNPTHLERMHFSPSGLAEIVTKEGWRYVTREGRSVSMVTCDNGPDPFSEGLARAIAGSKIGFVDEELNWRVRPIYDGAMPFESGRALVCIGCRDVHEGEHDILVDGCWGYIDVDGDEVTAIVHSREELK